MKAEGHRRRAEEVLASREKLTEESDVALYVAATFHVAHQFIAAFLLENFDEHHDKHQALVGALRSRGQFAAADAFQELDNARAGRWYGKRRNGDTIRRANELLETVRSEIGAND